MSLGLMILLKSSVVPDSDFMTGISLQLPDNNLINHTNPTGQIVIARILCCQDVSNLTLPGFIRISTA